MKYASVICILRYLTNAIVGEGIAYSSGTNLGHLLINLYSIQPLLLQHNTFIFGGFNIV
jgi:hypothetical protein